jgi:hypothetical protein
MFDCVWNAIGSNPIQIESIDINEWKKRINEQIRRLRNQGMATGDSNRKDRANSGVLSDQK